MTAATAASTDVRDWLREHGQEPPERGPIPRGMRAAYDEAHATAPADLDGEPDEPGAGSYEGAVTAADFAGAAPPPTAPAAGERQPQSVRGTGRALGSVRRAWARGKDTGAGADRGKGKRKRISLQGFVEDLYGDLAWLAGGASMVPLSRILNVQASYAGVIAEAQFKDTIVDTALQPVARAQGALAAFNGLVGPPVFVGAIMTTGQRVQTEHVVADEHGQTVFRQGPDGSPLRDPDTGALVPATMISEDFDTRTKMMFVGLRYCLLQMTKVTTKAAKDIIAAGEQRMNRGREVDELIAWIFGMPSPADTRESTDEETAIKRAQSLIGGDDAG